MTESQRCSSPEHRKLLEALNSALVLIRLLKAGFNPNQPRVPAGQSEGGQWVGSNTSTEKPYVAVDAGIKIVINHPNGIIEVREMGSRAWRNNNPGNLRHSNFANNHGSIGKAGGFAVFPDEDTGQKASMALLQSTSYSSLTIDEAIAKRSPNIENDTSALQNLIRRLTGLSGNKIIGNLTKEELMKLANAIKRTEGWHEGQVSYVMPKK